MRTIDDVQGTTMGLMLITAAVTLLLLVSVNKQTEKVIEKHRALQRECLRRMVEPQRRAKLKELESDELTDDLTEKIYEAARARGIDPESNMKMLFTGGECDDQKDQIQRA